MRMNVEKVLERDQKLSELDDRSSNNRFIFVYLLPVFLLFTIWRFYEWEKKQTAHFRYRVYLVLYAYHGVYFRSQCSCRNSNSGKRYSHKERISLKFVPHEALNKKSKVKSRMYSSSMMCGRCKMFMFLWVMTVIPWKCLLGCGHYEDECGKGAGKRFKTVGVGW